MKRSGDTIQLLALSLFIVILAFFIVLNTISDFEEKRIVPVLASLEDAFASKIIGQTSGPSINEAKRDIDLFSGGYMDELEVSLKQTFDIISVSRREQGRIMFVKLKRQPFLRTLEESSSLAFEMFKTKLSQVLDREAGQSKYHVNIIFYESAPYQDNISYMDSIPGLLEKINLQSHDYKLTVEKGDSSYVGLVFYPSSYGSLYRLRQ